VKTKRSTTALTSLLMRLWRHLSRHRQQQFMLIMGLMLLSAFAEVVSLGALLPFLGILTAPEAVFNYRIVARVAHALGITSARELLLPLTIAFVAIALLAGAIRMLQLWVSSRFTFSTGADLSIEVYRRTLYQPYHVHVARNSSEVISGITNKVGGTVLGVLLPLMLLISSGMLLVAIPVALIAIDPVVALVGTGGFGAGYAMITWLSRRRLRRNSQRIADEYTRVVKALQEGLGGIRDVLLDGTQPVYCEVYRQADQVLRRAQGDNVFIGQSPRFAMEALGMVLIAALAYVLSHQAHGAMKALPVLGALALGAQRLLPALQQAYAAWASMAGSHASLAATIELLDQPLPVELMSPAPAPLPLRSAIRFRGVRFRYASEGPWVLDGLDLTIPKGARIGLVGGTGSGKSTTLDLLMGLLVPTEGEVMVDGQVVTGTLARAWQRSIAHVPQSIYLADTTMAENIAFGVPRPDIDMARVRDAAHVGERGVRLSGGQRQRIGIARALYKRASVLVLDEATSALDNETERSVMQAIEGLQRNLTILLIAHRLSTVRHCDTIAELEHGRIVAQAPYEELLQCSQSFRRMAHAAKSI
jgi:ATP-binding cassette subfamily B protein